MPDSGLERTALLPPAPTFLDSSGGKIVDGGYFAELHRAIGALYDDVTKRINEFLYFVEWQEHIPAQFTADQNNYLLPDDGIVFRFSSDAARALTGIAAPLVPRLIICLNTGSFNLTLSNNSASSIAGNRIITATGADIVLQPNQSTALWYDIATARWRTIL